MKSIEEREKELDDKRRRDKIADIGVVVALLIVTYFNYKNARDCDLKCDKSFKENMLGISDINKVKSNYTLNETLSKLNLTGDNIKCSVH